MIAISSRSCAANSARPPLSYSSTDSWRCLIIFWNTPRRSASVRGGFAFPARGDVGVLDGRIDHAQRGKLALVLGPHRVLDRIVDIVAQHRPVLSRPMTPHSSKPLI